MALVLIRYGELALKSHKVRRRFEENLINGIGHQFDRYDLEWIIENDHGRIFLHTSPEQLSIAILLLRHIPGIVSVSHVEQFEITNGLTTIVERSARFSLGCLKSGQSFVVRARRAGSHAFTSQEAAALSGEKILDAVPGSFVKLKKSDVTIHLEIRGRRGYLFTESHKGMGGLPPGSQGKVMLLLSGPNSMIAGYLLMKRGCKIIPVHYIDHDSEIEEQYNLLKLYDPFLRLVTFQVPMNEESLLSSVEGTDALAVVTGHRTSNFDPTFSVGTIPVFHPLTGHTYEMMKRIHDEMTLFQEEIEILYTGPGREKNDIN